ncbi:CYIR protein [Plasmodium cynomolgi strain B]|uniref:CYIR protein n=1 Tax=Plasmodium cynomolgi (strain B) TaxID=1120755 RepID=K6VJU8_PLACD|nr:CYIR protein [Plasmodium cynomolgi strain B]GAB69702.1 CYIR protein [Plasmodium cynomolgi strain B]
MVVCDGNYSPIDQDEFNKSKVLFYYSKDYQDIQRDAAHGEPTCDKDYKEYVENYISMYNKAYLECSGEKRKTNLYCHNFYKLFEKNQYATLSSFTCTLSEKHNEILEQPKEHITQKHAQNEQSVETTIVQDSLGHQSTADGYTLEREPSSKIQQNLEKMQPVAIQDNAEGGHSKSITGSVVPVLGVPFISFLLYRFTPAGGFINKLLGRNINMYNPIEVIDESNPYSEEMVDGRRRINISYHRL